MTAKAFFSFRDPFNSCSRKCFECFKRPVLPIRLKDIRVTFLFEAMAFNRMSVSFCRSQKYSGPIYPPVTNGLVILFFILRDLRNAIYVIFLNYLYGDLLITNYLSPIK